MQVWICWIGKVKLQCIMKWKVVLLSHLLLLMCYSCCDFSLSLCFRYVQISIYRSLTSANPKANFHKHIMRQESTTIPKKQTSTKHHNGLPHGDFSSDPLQNSSILVSTWHHHVIIHFLVFLLPHQSTLVWFFQKCFTQSRFSHSVDKNV